MSEATTKLFMSADLVQATAFKAAQQGTADKPGWLAPFEDFFRELPLILIGQVAMLLGDDDAVPETLGVWKVLGDEVVFCAEPRDDHEALVLVEAFYRTVVHYDAKLFQRWPLRLRGCCWAARIPGRNIEVAIPEMATGESSGHAVYHDYMGPDVDTGFRIAGRADAGHVIVALDLAQALAGLSGRRGIQFHYVGREVLKGVFCGRPYPLILITFPDAMPEIWQWELQESQQAAVIKDEPPMAPSDLVALADRINHYLNRMCALNLGRLTFGPTP